MKAGTRVVGWYMGRYPIRGVIRETQIVTTPGDGAVHHYVDLDEPLEIFSYARESVLMTTKWDGSPSTYTRGSDRLRAL